jgi:hypothetical protein
VAALFFLSGPAGAQQYNCGKREAIIKQLGGDYQEAQIGAGIARGGGLVEIWVNPDSGSWSLLVTMPGGATCLMISGQDWRTAPKVDADPVA